MVWTDPKIVGLDVHGNRAARAADVYIYKLISDDTGKSPAIGAGLAVGATVSGTVVVPSSDQRGAIRPSPTKTTTSADIGAFELYIPATTITLDSTDIVLLIADTAQLKVTNVEPANAISKDIVWESSNAAVATVSLKGLITGVSPGDAVISATIFDGGATGVCKVTVKSADVPVIGVTLDMTSNEINIGEDFMLTATVAPAGATNKDVTWSTTGADIASFDILSSDTVTITTRAPGKATITVTTTDGGKTASCDVTVIQPVTKVTLSEPQTIKVGESFDLIATVEPEDATSKDVTWKSSDESIATVSTSGRVLGIKSGNAVITVTTVGKNSSGEQLSTNCEITVTPATISVTDVKLNKSATSLKVDETDQLTATVLPVGATTTTVSWGSNNTSVATVSTSGLVTAKAAGTATITVTTTDGGRTATCTVTVTPDPIKVTGITITPTKLSLTGSASSKLTAHITPSDAANQKVTWKSSNTSVASVSESGVVNGNAPGTTTITATTDDGGKTATCAVTITVEEIEPVKPIIKDKPKDVEPAEPKNETDPAEAAKELKDTGLKETDLEVVNGAVRIVAEITHKVAENMEKGKISSFDTTYELPVFTATIAKTGDVVAIGYELKGKELLAGTPEKVQVLKILSPVSGEMFTYQSVPAEFGDKVFTVQDKKDEIVPPGTKIDTGAKYNLILFIKDGGTFDLDGKADAKVVDPTSVLGTPQAAPEPDPDDPKRRGGGCSATYAPFALLLAVPFVLRKKK